jgi:hypothetical protein
MRVFAPFRQSRERRVVNHRAAATDRSGVPLWHQLGVGRRPRPPAPMVRANRVTHPGQQAPRRCRPRDRAGARSSPRISSSWTTSSALAWLPLCPRAVARRRRARHGSCRAAWRGHLEAPHNRLDAFSLTTIASAGERFATLPMTRAPARQFRRFHRRRPRKSSARQDCGRDRAPRRPARRRGRRPWPEPREDLPPTAHRLNQRPTEQRPAGAGTADGAIGANTSQPPRPHPT